MTTEITKIINGFKQFSENPYLDTINFLREYIKVEPSDEAFFELGKALFFNEDYGESIKCLERADDLRSSAYLGLNHYAMKDYENAISSFEEFSKENANETIMSYLMLSYEKTGNWQKAVRTGERLLDVNPDNRSVMARLIDCHFNLSEYQKSIDCIDELTRTRDPLDYTDEIDYKKLKFKRGLALFKLKRYDEAISELKDIKSMEAYRLICKSYDKLDKPSRAIRYLWRIYERDQDIEILFEISEISCNNRSHQYSIHVLERILDMDPGNVRALEMMVKNYFELQKFDLAIIWCEELLKINKNNFTAYFYLSEIYPYFDNIEKALEYAEKGLAINPKSAALWTDKAWHHYCRDDDFESFKKAYETALRLEPTNTENYILLIHVCGWENDRKSAQKYYERLLFYNPTCTLSFDKIFNSDLSMKSYK